MALDGFFYANASNFGWLLIDFSINHKTAKYLLHGFIKPSDFARYRKLKIQKLLHCHSRNLTYWQIYLVVFR